MLLNKLNFLPRLFVSPKNTSHAATKGMLIDTAAYCTVATDRYSMLIVKAPKYALAADFPIMEGYKIDGDQSQAATHIMPAEAVKQIAANLAKIKKVVLPIMANAAPLKVEQENAAGYVTTTLDNSQPVIYQKISDAYPNYGQVIPGDEKTPAAVIYLNPAILETMAKAFKLAGVTAVKIQVYSELEPVKFTATAGDSQEITGVIMPVKS